MPGRGGSRLEVYAAGGKQDDEIARRSEVIDEVRVIADDDAYEMARRLAREEGLLVGVSAGANVYVAAELACEMGPKAKIATILCDSGLRYLSTRAFE